MRDVHSGTILIVEDDDGVATLERRRLERAGYRALTAANPDQALEQLQKRSVDLILLDYRLPGEIDGLEFYSRVQSAGFDLPVILVTGFSSEATVIKALRVGVRDFVTKSVEYLDYLPEAVERVLRQVRTERQLAESEQRFRSMADNAPVFIWVSDPAGAVTFVNQTWLRFVGHTQSEECGEGWVANLHPDDAPATLAAYRAAVQTRGPFSAEYRVRRADGVYRWVLDSGMPRFLSDGGYAGHIGSAIDLTERHEAEELARDQAALLGEARDAIIVADMQDRILYWNRGAERLYGWRSEEIVGQNAGGLLYRSPAVEREEANRITIEKGEWSGMLQQVTRNGQDVYVESRRTLLRDTQGRPKSRLIINTDVTEKKRLESQFLHAQKLEAIGHLAGGVAHDFNNLLTVVSGYSEMLLGTSGMPPSAEELIREISRAGQRAAGLTRQLLAFSRKQILQPIPLDLNSLVSEIEKLLRRLIGEDISLTASLAGDLGQVRADPGQIEQVVINLAVNARDAMPQGGSLTIETQNVELDAAVVGWCGASAERNPEVRPGRYVLLAMTDTGHGMDEATRSHIFEPFFTTKPQGKGTGLGLATVYGIVKQSNGHIQVYSEPNCGTTVKVYLPRTDSPLGTGRTPSAEFKLPRGTETILVVEDEDGVRSLARLALQSLGYTILEAEDGNEALQVVANHEGRLDLVVTDVVLPHMGGPHLATHLAALRPGVRVLFVSGYTDDAVIRHGVLQADVAFLQKPFTPASLARKVREVLDAPHPPTDLRT